MLLYILIIACEIAFWVFLVAGLAARYLLRWNRVSKLLLIGVPLVDVALLIFTVLHLKGGAQATFAHGLATAYVGFTVAFGPVMVQWADQHFAHRFAGGPVPEKAPSQGWAGMWYELKLWFRCLFAIVIIYVLLFAMIAFVDDPARTQALNTWFAMPLFMAFTWFVFGPLWNLVFFGVKPKQP